MGVFLSARVRKTSLRQGGSALQHRAADELCIHRHRRLSFNKAFTCLCLFVCCRLFVWFVQHLDEQWIVGFILVCLSNKSRLQASVNEKEKVYPLIRHTVALSICSVELFKSQEATLVKGMLSAHDSYWII